MKKRKKKQNILQISSPLYKKVEIELSNTKSQRIQIAYIIREVDKRLSILSNLTYSQCDTEFLQFLLTKDKHLYHLIELLSTIESLKRHDEFAKFYICELIEHLIIESLEKKRELFNYYFTLDKDAYIIDYLDDFSKTEFNQSTILTYLQFIESSEKFDKNTKDAFIEKNKDQLIKLLSNSIHITEPKPYSHLKNQDSITHVKLDLSRPIKEIIDIITALKQEHDRDPSKFKQPMKRLYNATFSNYPFSKEESIKRLIYNKRVRKIDIISKFVAFLYIFDHKIIGIQSNTKILDDIYNYFLQQDEEKIVSPTTAVHFMQAAINDIKKMIDIEELRKTIL